MLERGRLTDIIKFNEPCTREQRLSIVKNLTSFYKRNFKIIYRPGEEPVNGTYPIYRYKLPERKLSRINYIYVYRRKEFAIKIGDSGRV